MKYIKRPEQLERSRKSLNESVKSELLDERKNAAKETARKILESKKKRPSKKLDERAEMNIKNIDWLELNELLASLKETLDAELNDDLDYFRVDVWREGGKAYLDLYTKDADEVSLFGDFSVEDILSIDNPKDYGLDKDLFKEVKDKILAEKDEIEKKFIPKIAKDWGFRNVKPRESVESLKESDDNYSAVDDMIAGNLFKEFNHYILKNLPSAKYYDDRGNIVVASNYDSGEQASYDIDDGGQTIYISLIEKDDAALAEFVADMFNLRCGFDEQRKPNPGYNYVYKIYVPHRVNEMPIAKFIYEIGIDPNVFKDSKRAQGAIDSEQRKAQKKAKSEKR